MPRKTRTKIEIGSLSDVGKRRESNQDRVFSRKGKVGNLQADALLIVADGMGGHAAGDVAAQTAIDAFVAALGSAEGEQSALQTMERAAVTANRAVFEKAQRDGLHGMGTTLTAVALIGNQAVLAHIGDSRAYLLADRKKTQISTDHSFVEDEVRAGRITREQARTHPSRNVLTRALGIEQDARFQVDSFPLVGSQAVVLCSDGLHGYLTDEEIQHHATTLAAEPACAAMVKLANERGGQDNISVAIGWFASPRRANSRTKNVGKTVIDRTMGLDGGPARQRSWFLRSLRRLIGRRG